MKRVGYWISEKKRKKLDFEEHRERFRHAGIDLVLVDLKQSLETQGPFDLLVHKVTDILAKALQGYEPAQHAIQNLESYIQNHPECVVLDPLHSIQRLLDRFTQYQQVSKADVMKDPRCMIPTFVELNTTDINTNKEKLALAGVTFPLVCKPILAHGSTYAHKMAVIFNEEALKDISPPCVAQSFINHNAILYKILVVGCQQFIFQRPSLKNLYPGDHPTIFFDTQEVSKADSDHPLNVVDYATLEDQPTKPDWLYLDQLGQGMRAAMELDLFGIDVIIDSETNQYGIIDINFFPGFESIDNFFGVLLDHIIRVLDASDRGKLVNGRLMPSAQDMNSGVSVLNQLNRSELKVKGRSDMLTKSPVIDLIQRNLCNSVDEGRDLEGGSESNTHVIASGGLHEREDWWSGSKNTLPSTSTTCTAASIESCELSNYNNSLHQPKNNNNNNNHNNNNDLPSKLL